MDTSKIESLLEQLLNKQDELISRIESLETTIEGQLTEANVGISSLENWSSQIHAELDWWGDDPSLAKRILSELGNISLNCT